MINCEIMFNIKRYAKRSSSRDFKIQFFFCMCVFLLNCLMFDNH